MTNPPSPTGTDRLAELATLGGYFALPVAADDTWRCLTEFFADDVLADHVARTRTAVAASTGSPPTDIPIRMAASSFQLGVAARLLSPVIGAALCSGAVPILDRHSVRWMSSQNHAPLFAVADPTWVTLDQATSAQVIVDSVVPLLTDLGIRLQRLVALSPRIAMGNLTSAANGAVTVLAMTRPHLEAPGRTLVRALLRIDPLRGSGEFAGGHFRRNSCCLYYQAPGSGLCGDCVLVPASGSPR